MAAADAVLLRFRYVVDDASLTVTFCPAEVDKVNVEAETVSTVPDAPPAAGPDRAFEPPPAAAKPPPWPLPAAGWPGVAEPDVAIPTQTANATQASAAATIQPVVRFDSNRRRGRWTSCGFVVAWSDM
jgi:hypothetical protein